MISRPLGWPVEDRCTWEAQHSFEYVEVCLEESFRRNDSGACRLLFIALGSVQGSQTTCPSGLRYSRSQSRRENARRTTTVPNDSRPQESGTDVVYAIA